MFAAPVLCGLPAVFASGEASRRIGVCWMAVAIGVVTSIAWTNLHAVRPHPGSHLGFVGLLLSPLFWLPTAVLAIPVTWFCVTYIDRVTGDCFIALRRPTPDRADG